METVMLGLPNIVVHIDELLVHSSFYQEHSTQHLNRRQI
jgi:hypothetical protein